MWSLGSLKKQLCGHRISWNPESQDRIETLKHEAYPVVRYKRSKKAMSFPIVGIGASASGLESFSELVARVPARTGMAYVFVQHLDPGHDSLLVKILSKRAAFPVEEASAPSLTPPTQPANWPKRCAASSMRVIPRRRYGSRRSVGQFEERGFSVVQFEDSISFRYDYETRFRARWDAGEAIEIVVVFRPGELEFETLPADVLARARQLSFTLRDVFPRLSYGVVSQLETVHFEALFRAQTQYASYPVGEELTKDFVLQHVFSIVPSIITKESDLLRMLCQKHYCKVAVPEILEAYLVSVLSHRGVFQSWPLQLLIRDRAAFLEFLDER